MLKVVGELCWEPSCPLWHDPDPLNLPLHLVPGQCDPVGMLVALCRGKLQQVLGTGPASPLPPPCAPVMLLAVVLCPCLGCRSVPWAAAFTNNSLEMKAGGLCRFICPPAGAEQPACLAPAFQGMLPLTICARARGQQANIWKVWQHCHLSSGSWGEMAAELGGENAAGTSLSPGLGLGCWDHSVLGGWQG